MKKSLTTILILLISFQSVFLGMYLIVKKEHNYTQTIKNLKQISKQNLIEFSFTEDSFHKLNWVKPDKEFILNTDFYDIVSFRKQGNIITLVCYKDIRDKEIALELRNNSKSDSKNAKQLTKFTDLKYFEVTETNVFDIFLEIETISEEIFFPEIIFKKNTCPPPKFSI